MQAARADTGALRPPARARGGVMELLGVPINDLSSPEILDFMSEVILGDEQAVVLHVNAHASNLAARYAWLREYYGEAALVFCDGDGIRLGLRLLGLHAPAKVTYNEFLSQLARRCEERGFSIYLLGGRAGVAAQAGRNLKTRYPRLRIVGTRDGYFAKRGPESDQVVEQINCLRPDVLLVCFGMPLQELWLRENAPGLAVHVVFTGGAALDYAAGVVPVAPGWMKRLQLEWLFRLLVEPRRLFARYVIGNPLFLSRVILERWRRQWRRVKA